MTIALQEAPQEPGALHGAGPAPAAPAASSAQTPSDRATTFQAVQGEPEHYSGEKLLVGAYAAAWAIILLWIALVWRKQSETARRLSDLERVVGEAAAQRSKTRDPARPDS